MCEKRVLGVVIARAGSTGLPGKNYKEFCGKPLVVWSIIQALESKYIDIVAISSNCDGVRKAYEHLLSKIHQEYVDKLIWIERDESLAGSLVKNEPVIIDAYYKAKERKEIEFDIIAHFQPTSPIRDNHLIDQCFDYYFENQYDSLVTVTKTTPFIWYKRNNEKWYCENGYYINRPMRQEISDTGFIYHDNGSVYITNKDILINKNNRLGGKVGCFVLEDYQGYQIDSELDFNYMEMMVKDKNLFLSYTKIF